MKPTLLFFTCFNVRSVQLESSIYYFHKKGYRVLFLTTCAKGPIHYELEKNGITAATMPVREFPRILYYPRAIWFFIKYCKQHQVGFVHSHLQIPNLISSVSNFFMKAIVFNVRHNSDVVALSGTLKEKWIDRLVNTFSRHIIAISGKVKTQLVEHENVDPRKIHAINNGYDFGQYELLSEGPDTCFNIRRHYACQLLILSPGRLINTKRHDLLIEAMSRLKSEGLDIKLLILGDGPELHRLQDLVIKNALGSQVFLPGYRENISDFFKASDVVTLLSASEASSNTVKEAGYFGKPVIVCHNVGDFDDYLISGRNGWLVSKEDPVPDFINHIKQLYQNKQAYDYLGMALKDTILNEFDMRLVGEAYERLQKKLRPY